MKDKIIIISLNLGLKQLVPQPSKMSIENEKKQLKKIEISPDFLTYNNLEKYDKNQLIKFIINSKHRLI